ncbi:SH3 domain-containing protein [Nioella aestuarii]|uniref:SH3 domain-containing protein n=1 Tax=Nioella aestuarii TaxID=1662864 RepID=UPI003D7FD49B
MPYLSVRRTVAVIALLVLPSSLLAQDMAFDVGEVPASVENGGFRYFSVMTESGPLNLHDGPSAGASVTARLARGTFLNNLGCQGGAERAWCDVQPVGGGPRGYVAAEFLAPGVGPNGAAMSGYDDSASRAGQRDFDATGAVACRVSAGQAPAQCPFGVARAGGGDATMIVTLPDGRSRAIFFQLGQAIGADGIGTFTVTRMGDTSLIALDGETYEVPDAIPLGG